MKGALYTEPKVQPLVPLPREREAGLSSAELLADDSEFVMRPWTGAGEPPGQAIDTIIITLQQQIEGRAAAAGRRAREDIGFVPSRARPEEDP